VDVVDLDADIKPDLGSAVSIEIKSKNVVPGASIDSLTASLPPAFEELFRGGDNKSGQGSLFFVQLPNVIADMLVTTANVSQRNAAEVSQQSTVKAEPMDVDKSVSAPNGVPIKADPDGDVMQVDISKESSTADESKTRKRAGQHALADVPHGRIGKLQLLKSGRVRLKLNEAVEGEPLIFDAAPGTKTTFLQQVVSIKTNNQSGETNEEGGELFVLGDISHRLLLTPKIDNLLSNLKKASR